jgi:hypothetical protein
MEVVFWVVMSCGFVVQDYRVSQHTRPQSTFGTVFLKLHMINSHGNYKRPQILPSMKIFGEIIFNPSGMKLYFSLFTPTAVIMTFSDIVIISVLHYESLIY